MRDLSGQFIGHLTDQVKENFIGDLCCEIIFVIAAVAVKALTAKILSCIAYHSCTFLHLSVPRDNQKSNALIFLPF